MPRRTPRDVAVAALQYGLGLAALAWVLTQVPVGETLATLGRLDARTVAALLALSVAGLLGRFYSWHVLLARAGIRSIRAAASVDLTVYFLNQLLPSRLSGRVAAPFVIRSRTGLNYADATSVSGVHTGAYAVLYGIVAAIGLLAGYSRLPTGIVLLLAISTGLYLAAGGAVLLAGTNLTLLDRLVSMLEGLATRIPRVGPAIAARVDGVRDFAAESSASFRDLAADPSVWARYAAGWTLFTVVAPGGRVLVALAALGAGFEPAALLPLYLVAAYSVTLLPLTPGGIGVTEATTTVVLVAFGVPEAVAVPVVLLDRALGVYLPALAGWYPAVGLGPTPAPGEE
ncbi:lysylphosphatidylglycerol synthase transmembrane domain-containing protein [Halopenitus malekzadehii]|uniref:lysylphosphatidylglycerol synthase transmembrane domain-containing protein n=1 Tax=Halopenitus malekzadehii TaxID=1267564 RepID=UPI000B87F62C|nr:lysylphosphatidylglycerol synthase transmembrane domain-containing protein [Halopenitus malekzadehii]